MKEKCNPGYYAATNIPIYIPLDNGKQMGWTSNGMPCSFKPTTSSHDYSGIGLGQIGGDRYRISPNHSISYSSFEKQFLERTPTTYTSPNFVPYTQSSQSFLEEPKYINPIISSYTGVAIGLLPKDVNQLKSQAKTKLDNLTADIAIRLSQGKHPQHDQIIGKLLKELKSEADRIKSEAITPSDRLRADILIQEAWKTDAELHLLIAVKNNDHGEHGIEFRNKQLSEYDKEIHKLTKELIAEADRIKGEAITQSDRLRSDILIQEAWKTDAEWHRREAVKNNDHGVHGIEFRNNQLSEYDKEIYRLTKALIAEADKIKAEAITLSDRLRADILIQEAWKTDAEWHRREAVKNNDHGVHGIEFRNNQLPEYVREIHRLTKALIAEADRIKSEAITPSDHLRADILIQEAWKTDAEWHRREAVKNNDHGEYGIEFRNKQLPEYDKEIYRLIKDFTKNNADVNLSGLNINDNVAKLLADSLSKGEMPNLKKLHLEGNKITDEGENFIIKTIKDITQHIIVLTRDLKDDGKMIFGSREEKIIEYKKILAKCSEQGINDQAIVVNKTSFDKTKNLVQVGASTVIGFSKCHWELETLTQWYAQDKILAKLPKIGKILMNTFNVDDILSCYVEAKNEAFISPIGCQIIKDELCVMGEAEFCE